jgi:hypothetical protein
LGTIKNLPVRRIQAVVFWLTPPLLALWVHWRALQGWYWLDDFQWLGQALSVDSLDGLLYVLLQPASHGTWRPLSERLSFLVFGPLFGDNALPLHLLSMATLWGCQWLLAALVRRLTGSVAAALAAVAAWTCTLPLVMVTAWISAWMQLICLFLMLAALHCRLRYEESGAHRWLRLEWIAFIAALGTLETALVYPALACTLLLALHRRLPRGWWALWAAALAYFGFHAWYAPKAAAGVYAQHFDPISLATTLREHWLLLFAHPDLARLLRWPAGALPWLECFFAVALVGWSAYALWRGNRTPFFGLAAFLILLGPVLPLRDHVIEYYAALPLLGLAIVFGSLAAVPRWRWAGAALLALFLAVQWPLARGASRWYRDRSDRIEGAVRGILALREAQPHKAVLLVDPPEEFVACALRDAAFEAFGERRVFLEATPARSADPALARYMTGSDTLRRRFAAGLITAVAWRGTQLVDVTNAYADRMRANSFK